MKKILALTVSLAILSVSLVSFLTVAAAPVSAIGANVSDWNDFFNTCTQGDPGVNMFAHSSLKQALNPGYVSMDLNIKALTETVDCWVTMGFVSDASAALDITAASPSGIMFLMRNQGGNLSVQGYKMGNIGSPIFTESFGDIHAVGTTHFVFEKQPDGAYTMTIGGNVRTLTGLTESDFTNSAGKTYLAFAAYDAGPAGQSSNLRSWNVSNILNEDPYEVSAIGTKVADWNDDFNTCTQDGTGVNMSAQSSLKQALDPDYVSFDLDFKSLSDQVDCWVAAGLVNEAHSLDATGTTPSGIVFMMRKSGDKLNVTGYKTGHLDAPIFSEDISGTTVPGVIPFLVQKEADGTYSITIGTVKKALAGLSASDFTDSNGNTYLAFAAYDSAQSLSNRNWTVMSILNAVPQLKPNDSSSINPDDSDSEPSDVSAPNSPADENGSSVAAGTSSPTSSETTGNVDTGDACLSLAVFAAGAMISAAALLLRKKTR